MTNSLIPHDIVDVLSDTVDDIIGDGARIFLVARHRAPELLVGQTPGVLTEFLARVLGRCAAHLSGQRVEPSPQPARDAVLAEEVLRSVARWPREQERAVQAWQLAINLVALAPGKGG